MKSVIKTLMRDCLLGSCFATLFLITGCASYDIAKPVKSFSDATSAATETTRQAFQSTDQTFLRRRVEEVIAAYPSNHAILSELSFKNLNPYLPPDQLQARLDVLAGLQTYAEKLAALAGNEQLDAFDQQAAALGENLSKFNDDLVKTKLLPKGASETEIKILSTSIREMGDWLIKSERRQAVKKAVTDMDPNVQKIAGFLKSDLNDLARQADNDYHQIVASLMLPIKEGITSDSAREQRLRQVANTILDGKKAIATANDLGKVADKLGQAHSLLADAVTKPNSKFNDLVQDIYDECKSAKQFYDSLGK
jgi:hypothetical protein